MWIVPTTVTARSFWPGAPSGIAAAVLATMFTLAFAGTSLGAAGNQPGAQEGAQGQSSSSVVLGPGTGYGVEGGSKAVRQLQRRLRTVGYSAGPVDGVYGPRTAAAVRRFQEATGLAPDGVAGPQTVSAAASPRGGLVRPGAGYGSPGGDVRVRDVQRMLRALGYDPGVVDGRFGERTQSAVQWFQAKHGLRSSGVVDPASLRRLRRLARDRPLQGPATPRLVAPLASAGWHGRPVRNPQPDRGAQLSRWVRTHGPVHPLALGAGYRAQDGSPQVRRIQRVLHELGYKSGPVDGRFGPRTRASVQWLQVKYGLEPSGTIDVATAGHARALARGGAPAPEQVKGSPSRPPGNPAQPESDLATAQAVALGNNAAPLLVVAVLAALGASALWSRRRQPLGGR